VTLALGNNPGSGTLSCTLTQIASSGVATFNNLSIDKVGTGYTLTATSGVLTGTTSSAFNINLHRILNPVGNGTSQTNDHSSGSNYYLDSTEVLSLNANDSSRWTTRSNWPDTISTNNYLNFVFPSDITRTTLDSAQLTFVWQRESSVDEARIRIYDGSTWSSYYNISMPSANSDSTVTLDLKSYGINSIAKVNAMIIQFQAARGGFDSSTRNTLHNLVQVDVIYH
jgi:hypothetical protein